GTGTGGGHHARQRQRRAGQCSAGARRFTLCSGWRWLYSRCLDPLTASTNRRPAQDHRLPFVPPPPMPAPMSPLAMRAWTVTTALGRGVQAQHAALLARRSGLRRNDFGPANADGVPLPCWIGRVDGLEDAALPARFAQWDCRNNRLAWLALQSDGMLDTVADALVRHGADRVALVLG